MINCLAIPSAFDYPYTWEWLGPGGLPGLQNLWRVALRAAVGSTPIHSRLSFGWNVEQGRPYINFIIGELCLFPNLIFSASMSLESFALKMSRPATPRNGSRVIAAIY